MWKTWMGASLLLLVDTCANPVGAQDRSQPCAVTAQSPGRVSSTGQLTGTATLPPGAHLWVLARMKGLAGWWPQGGGPAVVENDGRWTVHVTYGTPTDLGMFDVAVVVVGPRANQELMTWVANAPPAYAPTQFPNTPPQCPVRMLVAQKVSR